MASRSVIPCLSTSTHPLQCSLYKFRVGIGSLASDLSRHLVQPRHGLFAGKDLARELVEASVCSDLRGKASAFWFT